MKTQTAAIRKAAGSTALNSKRWRLDPDSGGTLGWPLEFVVLSMAGDFTKIEEKERVLSIAYISQKAQPTTAIFQRPTLFAIARTCYCSSRGTGRLPLQHTACTCRSSYGPHGAAGPRVRLWRRLDYPGDVSTEYQHSTPLFCAATQLAGSGF